MPIVAPAHMETKAKWTGIGAHWSGVFMGNLSLAFGFFQTSRLRMSAGKLCFLKVDGVSSQSILWLLRIMQDTTGQRMRTLRNFTVPCDDTFSEGQIKFLFW